MQYRSSRILVLLNKLQIITHMRNRCATISFAVIFLVSVIFGFFYKSFCINLPRNLVATNGNLVTDEARRSVHSSMVAYSWIASLGDIARDGVMLSYKELRNGDVENVYFFPGGLSLTQYLAFPATDRLLGSLEYEELSLLDFEKRSPEEPCLFEVKKILEECPNVINSGMLFSCIREIYTMKTQLVGVIKRHRNETLLSFGSPPNQLVPQESFEFKTIYFRARLEQIAWRKRIQKRLRNVGAEVPDEVFQRLLSIQLLKPADELGSKNEIKIDLDQ